MAALLVVAFFLLVGSTVVSLGVWGAAFGVMIVFLVVVPFESILSSVPLGGLVVVLVFDGLSVVVGVEVVDTVGITVEVGSGAIGVLHDSPGYVVLQFFVHVGVPTV